MFYFAKGTGIDQQSRVERVFQCDFVSLEFNFERIHQAQFPPNFCLTDCILKQQGITHIVEF